MLLTNWWSVPRNFFFPAKIRDSAKDQKQLFKLTSRLMGNMGQVILPIHESAEQLTTTFGDFYIDKNRYHPTKHQHRLPNWHLRNSIERWRHVWRNLASKVSASHPWQREPNNKKSPNKSCDYKYIKVAYDTFSDIFNNVFTNWDISAHQWSIHIYNVYAF